MNQEERNEDQQILEENLRLVELAQAILARDSLRATYLIEEGLPVNGRKVIFPMGKGGLLTCPSDVPQKWMDEGLSPLTWVVTEMLALAKECSSDYPSSFFGAGYSVFGSGVKAPQMYSPKVLEELENLSMIGGELLNAGAKKDTRMGATKLSQKAIDAMNSYLPEYSQAFQAAAHRRALQELRAKIRPKNEDEEYVPPRPKM